MHVVDRDGLDGLVRIATDAGAIAAASALIAGLGMRRVETASGLLALAEASRAGVPAEAPALGSWTQAEPLALVTGDSDVDAHATTLFAPHQRAASRHARPTVPAPVGQAAAVQRLTRPTGRIVLSSIAALAAAAALLLVSLRAASDPSAPAASASAKPAGTTPVASPRSGQHVSRVAATARGASTLIPAATIDADTPRRPLALPPTRTAADFLEWRVPTHFAAGSDAPQATDTGSLPALVATLSSRCIPGSIVVTGHTCALGTEFLNQDLGRRRARNTRLLLIEYGLPARHLRTLTAASHRPEADNHSIDGRAKNRRVTVACKPQPVNDRRQARGER